MNILLITRSQDDYCTPLVMDAIKQRGGTAWRLDTDRLPTEHRLSLAMGKQIDRIDFHGPQGSIDLRTMDALYYRRFAPGDLLPNDMPPDYRSAAVKETRLTLLGLLYGLRCFQLDGYEKVRRAETKQLQLQIAHAIGLEIPDSLTSNDPQAVRAFAQAHPEGIVTKMLGSFAIYEEGKEKVVFTSKMQPEHLADLESLNLCPMTFQACIPKALELRVTVVGTRIFSASIDSQALPSAAIDWRREGHTMIEQWRHYELPKEVADKVLQVMDAVGLNYGALDFIVTPDGSHVFLEVNPAGEFMWLQKWPGLPIADALADVLMGLAPRR